MNRQIVCRECGEEIKARPLHPEDRAAGWERRVRYIDGTKIPPGHGMTANGIFEAMDDLHCDHCNKVVSREICIAITNWRPKIEPEPDDWEKLYGNIIPDESVKVSDKLSKP